MGGRVMVAMSGGVDSSVAALFMKRQGYETVGVTMKLFGNEDIGIGREKSCCSLDDADDAKSVSYRLGIPHYVFNFSEGFKENVIRRFADAYISGATPNPCIDCNRYIKFRQLMLRARQLDFNYIATGHYAVIDKDSATGRYLLKKASDAAKDQSYVLYMLNQEQLAMTLFPLGRLKKSEVRIIAEENGFLNARKRDSQDICFVKDGGYADFIEQYTGKQFSPGSFIDCNGNVIGMHKGTICYTVGQRKGLGITSREPVYVCGILPDENKVIVGAETELYSKAFYADNINLIACDSLSAPARVTAKIRYRQTEQPATVIQTECDRIRVEFDVPQRAVTRGQSVVLYDGECVVGGGVISGQA